MDDSDRLHYGAIALGIVVDTAGTIASAIALIVFTAAGAIVAGEDAAHSLDRWSTEPPLLLLELIVGLVWSGMGGFVAAVVARRAPVRHAVWVGVLTLLLGFGLWMVPIEDGALPVWFDVLSAAMIVPACITGGVLGARFLEPRSPSSILFDREG